ncbi:MAG: hypothetical protein JWR03_398 [Cohnella sp.]|nr:hypothetical protein [Cohnella sp.]
MLLLRRRNFRSAVPYPFFHGAEDKLFSKNRRVVGWVSFLYHSLLSISPSLRNRMGRDGCLRFGEGKDSSFKKIR